MKQMLNRTFSAALSRACRQLGARSFGERVLADDDVAFECEYDIITGLPEHALAELGARILLQADKDAAESVTLRLGHGRIVYVVAGCQRAMQCPPLPVLVDLGRAIWNASTHNRRRTRLLSLFLLRGKRDLEVEIPQGAPEDIVVRGFS